MLTLDERLKALRNKIDNVQLWDGAEVKYGERPLPERSPELSNRIEHVLTMNVSSHATGSPVDPGALSAVNAALRPMISNRVHLRIWVKRRLRKLIARLYEWSRWD